jgi:hypothetical protein
MTEMEQQQQQQHPVTSRTIDRLATRIQNICPHVVATARPSRSFQHALHFIIIPSPNILNLAVVSCFVADTTQGNKWHSAPLGRRSKSEAYRRICRAIY